MPKEGEFTSGLDFNKVTDGLTAAASAPTLNLAAAAAPTLGLVAAVATASPAPVDGKPSSSPNLLPPPQVEEAVSTPVPDPYERLENAVMRALVKEEGLIFSNTPVAYRELAKLYFGEANA